MFHELKSLFKNRTQAQHRLEVDHWQEVERRTRAGERLFWLNHPRIAGHYYSKALIDGLSWRQWVRAALGHPARVALELGCGDGAALADTIRAGVAESAVGLDLDESRFVACRELPAFRDGQVRFLAADVNTIALEENTFDLIYVNQSFHHFLELEHILEQVYRALTPQGYFVLDEYVGPPRFQWTDAQLALTAQLLGIMPRELRMYANGIEKRSEGRSTVEDVIRVCPSEAVRSDEIVPLFRNNFQTVRQNNLGGTIQHLLYSGIVQNFPDGDPETDHLIDCIDGIERVLIDHGIIPSDFVLLVGRRG